MAPSALTDNSYMLTALILARRGVGQCAPNPSVGCVIVNNGRVVGRGNTAPGGRPHAETIALEMAGKDAKGATAYVTLEPCSHHGKTPPCAEALIKAGIGRVVIACGDPNPQVNGAGIKMLKDAGIEVETGLLETEAREINKGFFRRITGGAPEVTVKIATTQDGSFTLPGKRWITGDSSRRFVHLMRAQHDAILTGIGTVLADNPRLDCRLPGFEDKPLIPIVLDSHLRLPEDAIVARRGMHLITTRVAMDVQAAKVKMLEEKGIALVPVDRKGGHLDMAAVLKYISGLGVNRLMVEAGPILTHTMLGAQAADSLYWFCAPEASGKSTKKPDWNGAPSDWKELDRRVFGADILRIYKVEKALQ